MWLSFIYQCSSVENEAINEFISICFFWPAVFGGWYSRIALSLLLLLILQQLIASRGYCLEMSNFFHKHFQIIVKTWLPASPRNESTTLVTGTLPIVEPRCSDKTGPCQLLLRSYRENDVIVNPCHLINNKWFLSHNIFQYLYWWIRTGHMVNW